MPYVVKPKSVSVIDFQKTYRAELIKITEDPKFVRFTFTLLDVSSKPIASGICPNEDLEPGTRLYKWFSALNGGELVEGASIDPEEFINRVVEVKLKNAMSNGIEYINVVDIIKLIPDSEY
jgi:hypothetical protein